LSRKSPLLKAMRCFFSTFCMCSFFGGHSRAKARITWTS
jgi:hypothetical protein